VKDVLKHAQLVDEAAETVVTVVEEKIKVRMDVRASREVVYAVLKVLGKLEQPEFRIHNPFIQNPPQS